MQGEVRQVMQSDGVLAVGSTLGGRSEQLGGIPGDRGRRHAAECQYVESGIERGLRCRVHRTIAEKRPRRGVADDGQDQIGDRVGAGALQGDRSVAGGEDRPETDAALGGDTARAWAAGRARAAVRPGPPPRRRSRGRAQKVNQREGTDSSSVPGVPAARPRPTVRSRSSRSASSRAPVASTASFGRPRARAKTLVEPPGTTARPGRRESGPRCSRPFTTSLTVPSPPRATTMSMSSLSAACLPRSRACPRYSVVTTSSFISLANAWIKTSRVRALVVVAAGLTTRSARMRCSVPTGWYSSQTEVGIQ